MSKNADFFNALSNSHELANKADKGQRDLALDALLKANPANPKAIREALFNHKAFWDSYDADLMTVPDELSKVTSVRKLVRSYYNTDRFLKLLPPEEPYSLNKIHQLAAEQRVKLGLKAAEDDVLIGILVHNEDECRAYLASKPQMGSLTQVHGWKTNEVVARPPAKNSSKHILTDEALLRIKKEAGELLLFRLIDESDDLYYLTALSQAKDQASIARAAVGIGFPNEGSASLSLETLEEVRDKVDERIRHLRDKHRNAELRHTNPQVVNRAIKRMHEQVEAIEAHLEPLIAHREDFLLLNSVQPINLFNPTVPDKASTEALAKKAEYEELSTNCDWYVSELERIQSILESYLNNLPEDNYPDVENAESKIKRLREKIAAELEEIAFNLEIYQEAQKKLKNLIKAIDEVSRGNKIYNYNGKGIKRGTGRLGELPAMPGSAEDVVSAEAGGARPDKKTDPSAPAVSEPTSVLIGTGGPNGFLLEERAPHGWVTYFDVTHRTHAGVESFGRFTEQGSAPDLLDKVVYKDGKIIKTPAKRLQIEQFPKVVDPTKSNTNLIEAKVNFSMAMAAQVLANLSNPPTQEDQIILTGENGEELAFLWTALVILGEKTPHMKFSSDAIKVYSSTFIPDNEKGTFWGFSGNSLYEQVFTHASMQVVINPPKEALAAVAKEKNDKADEEKVVAVTSTMRNRLMGIRDTGKEIREEGSLLTTDNSLQY